MGKDTAQKQGRLIAAILLIASQSADTDEAIWFSGPASCGGICVSSPPGAEPVPLNPHILESIEEDFISSFDLSPDGRNIAFMEIDTRPGFHYSDIWMMDSDGINLREIVEGGRGGWEASDSRGQYWTSSDINAFSLGIEWSPHGLEILVWSYSRGSFLFMDIEGNNLYSWRDSNVSVGRYFSTDLQWTPEGDIVYQGYENDTLFVRARNGPIKLRIPISGVRRPKLSPDGSKLAYGAWIPWEPPSLFVMDIESGEQQFIAEVLLPNFEDRSPIGPFSWSPSGNHIVYHDIDGLYVINVDGTDPEFLFETDVVWDVDWISDSSSSTGVTPTSWGEVKRQHEQARE